MDGGGWPASVTEIVGGDLCAAFAYTTRFGSVSVSAVCPFGIHDDAAGTIETSVPLAFVDKLRRLAEAPQAALGFFRRDHGLSSTPGYVLAQGEVSFPDSPPDGYVERLHERWPAYLGAVPEGGIVRALGGRAYYDDRVPVTLHVRRLLHWPTEKATGAPTVIGEPRPPRPAPQVPPARGSDPAVAPKRYAKQLGRDDDHLIAFIDGDGLPFVVPFRPRVEGDRIAIDRDDLPPGGRRAGLLGLWYRKHLHGQGMLNALGWLAVDADGATFAPGTCRTFNLSMGAFGQKGIVPIAAGAMYRKAARTGAIRDRAFVRPA